MEVSAAELKLAFRKGNEIAALVPRVMNGGKDKLTHPQLTAFSIPRAANSPFDNFAATRRSYHEI